MVTYFFFGPATLANLEPRLLATALVPLGEATVPRDGWAPEREGGTNTGSSVRFLLRLFLTRLGACIEVSGRCPLALLLGLQYLLWILFFLLLAGIVVV